MQAIRKPSERKQEMISRFFWLRTFLLAAKRLGIDLRMNGRQETAVIETVWNAQTAYTQADDDDYNFNIALETYQMLENGLMEAGVDVEAGISLVMQRNGYANFKQIGPNRPDLIRAFLEENTPVAVGDPWD